MTRTRGPKAPGTSNHQEAGTAHPTRSGNGSQVLEPEQLALDGVGPRMPVHGIADHWTSREAGRTAVQRGPTQRERVGEFLIERGDRGATDDEIAQGVQIGAGSAAKRRLELQRMGLVEPVHGAVRLTRWSSPAKVWRWSR